MRRLFKSESLLVENRFYWFSGAVLVVVCFLILRLWYIQVFQGDYYRKISENNRIRRIEIPAPRGVIIDRNGKLILGNRPFFDLVYIPQFVMDQDVTLSILTRLLHVPEESFTERIKAAKKQPKFLPITLKRNLSLHEVSIIESNKIFLPGVEINTAPRRDYLPSTPAHLVGYLGEIDQDNLDRLNKQNPNNPYQLGDLIGKHGLERRWEKYLRGKSGYRLIQVDAFGRRVDVTNENENTLYLPEMAAKAGSDLVLTIDQDLQTVTEDAFRGKSGAVVVLDPKDGAILAMVSSPGFSPTQYQSGLSAEEWQTLMQDQQNPLLDRTTGGEYPPGSVYKAIMTMAGLEEGVITPDTVYNCPGFFRLGNKEYKCHDKHGHGNVNLMQALIKSCDVYFYHVGVELGIEKIAKYARAFGLGKQLGVNLNMERPGLVPTSAWKKLTFHVPWIKGETPPVAIGQGYNLITPIQMANLFASIANGGLVWQPFIVRRVVDSIGETLYTHTPMLLNKVEIVKPETFKFLRVALQNVVMAPGGTGWRANVPGTTVAGKTGTVQVVSMKKNTSQLGISMKWREHTMFAAFSPVEIAEIALAVVSENDAEGGGGGRVSAPIASKIIQAYWDLKNKKLKIAAGNNLKK